MPKTSVIANFVSCRYDEVLIINYIMINKGFLFFGVFFIIFFILLLLYLIIVNAQSNRKFVLFSQQFNLDTFNKFEIRFREMGYQKNSLTVMGGMWFFNATLYYSDDLIIIKQKGIFSILLSTSIIFFPLILKRNPEKTYEGFVIQTPYSIYKTSSFPLKIKYRTKIYDSEISIIPIGDKDIKDKLEEKLLRWLK